MKENEIRKLESEIHHEFQLERVILFSDAVFAIAITLMVIELKFPEIGKKVSADEFWDSFRPLFRNFFAFMVSFFFIGMYWYRHLKLCGLLVDYNRTFITLNLLFLFFIVLFPFSVSTMTHLSNDFFIFPMLIYFGNIFFAMVTHFILYMYLLRTGSTISKPISPREKQILREASFIPIILISLIGTAFILTRTIFKDHQEYSLLILFPTVLFVFFIRRRMNNRHRQIKEEIIHNQK